MGVSSHRADQIGDDGAMTGRQVAGVALGILLGAAYVLCSVVGIVVSWRSMK